MKNVHDEKEKLMAQFFGNSRTLDINETMKALDPTMRIIVKRMLVDAMLDRQLTTVISSHNLKEINEVCDRVALLHQGNIVF